MVYVMVILKPGCFQFLMKRFQLIMEQAAPVDFVDVCWALCEVAANDALEPCANSWRALYNKICSFPASSSYNFLQEHSDEVWFLQFSHNGQYLASASGDHLVIIWEVNSDGRVTLKNRLSGHQKPIFHVSWSPDSLQLLTCGVQETSRRWNVYSGECRSPEGKEVECWKGQQIVSISDLGVTSDGKKIITKSNVEKFVEEDVTITSFSLSSDNKLLLVTNIPDMYSKHALVDLNNYLLLVAVRMHRCIYGTGDQGSSWKLYHVIPELLTTFLFNNCVHYINRGNQGEKARVVPITITSVSFVDHLSRVNYLLPVLVDVITNDNQKM
ncbi:hypothetical protein POM88_054829 [Heracleum sosnowskyi]|uniref:Uncharacterized protein n=1 Tax=Heracleum sosnowskyi TaxID=360622 RepID=A0AAD8LW78_9APIA|nr:hypothetical protein POM88_054829 [Heracleum sosnowskyi]